MKRTFKNIFLALTSSVIAFTSCIGDLDVNPLNPTEMSPNQAYGSSVGAYLQGLTKIYYSFINTSGLNVADGGASELIRAYWSCQEVTADACKCAWSNDAWVRALNTNTWSEAQNDATYAVYCRTILGISYANEFLRSSTDDLLDARGCDDAVKAKVRQFRAEARFLRAYFYWAAMDTFGQVPFSTENTQFGGGYNPPQKPAAEIFDFIVDELNDLASEGSAMPAAQSNYPRADKGSVLGLLARVYLNAEVYAGKEMWAEAKATCEKIYGLGYALAPTHAELFRGDNGENADAKKEMLFAASYDAENNQSYGGTTYLTLSTLSGDDGAINITGINGGWAGNRVPDHYVQTYFAPTAADFATGEYTIADKRGQYFYIKGRAQSMEGNLNTFLNGWSCIKYNNVPHDMDAVDYAATAATKNFSDIDWPLIRLGEIHLIYAEACMHAGGDASAQVAALAERAGVAAPAAIDADFLMAERARELMWEAHRRTDLIRYGKWISGYNWTFKGGNFGGQDLPAHFNVFPVPSTELATNLDLQQNPGYAR